MDKLSMISKFFKKTSDNIPWSACGFTLVELVLATLISAMVIGIMSVSLSFSLRTWERQRNIRGSEVPRIIDHLKWQIGFFNPMSMSFEGEKQIIFRGSERDLVLATDYSVKAVSKGVQVVARFVFVPEEKKLYYAEIPFDPYHTEPTEEFLLMKPDENKSWPRFFSIEMAEFSIEYQKEAGEGFTGSWEDTTEAPQGILVKWSETEDSTQFSYLLIPDFFLKRKIADKQGSTPKGPELN